MTTTPQSRRRLIRALSSLWAAAAFLLLPHAAHASFLSPELEDKLADIIAPAVVFGVLIMVMVFRPQGLFGEETREG